MNKQVLVGLIAALVLLFFTVTPTGTAMRNTWFGTVQYTDDATRYSTQKKVEDTCRAMIASYNADKLTYEQYKDSESEEKQSWAEQAKMRANRTASSYNNYILENAFVWEGNVPTDIDNELPYLE